MSFGDVNRLVAGLIRKGLSSAFNREIAFVKFLERYTVPWGVTFR